MDIHVIFGTGRGSVLLLQGCLQSAAIESFAELIMLSCLKFSMFFQFNLDEWTLSLILLVSMKLVILAEVTSVLFQFANFTPLETTCCTQCDLTQSCCCKTYLYSTVVWITGISVARYAILLLDYLLSFQNVLFIILPFCWIKNALNSKGTFSLNRK